MIAIEIQGLCKTYRGKKWAKVDALKGLDLNIERGEVFGFLGPNGAGKSTTIKILMGLIKANSGTARILGEDIGSSQARSKVGFLPENPSFYDHLSAEEHLTFVGKMFSLPPDKINLEMERVLKLLELWDVRKRPVRSFSKGMTQRLGLAQVLLPSPEVYVLDEPMSGLDPLGRALVKEMILDLKQRGKSVFFSTHITSDVEMVCDRVGVITNGVLRTVKDVQNVLREGITGYQVKSIEKGILTEIKISPKELSQTIDGIRGRGGEITLIEPERKHLEEFFLDIVHREE